LDVNPVRNGSGLEMNQQLRLSVLYFPLSEATPRTARASETLKCTRPRRATSGIRHEGPHWCGRGLRAGAHGDWHGSHVNDITQGHRRDGISVENADARFSVFRL
jgi:hypothetical protein